MKSRVSLKVVGKLLSWLTMGGVLAALSSTAAATSMSACGESGACTNLRESTYAELETWQACEPGGPLDQCIIEAGNTKDCTGVLACDFAINPKFRAEAEERVYSIGEASQGCYLCAVPNCVAAEIGYCEPISRRCIGVTAVTDGGLLVVGTPPPSGDSGTTPVTPIVDSSVPTD
jgi:hypothetical protein